MSLFVFIVVVVRFLSIPFFFSSPSSPSFFSFFQVVSASATHRGDKIPQSHTFLLGHSGIQGRAEQRERVDDDDDDDDNDDDATAATATAEVGAASAAASAAAKATAPAARSREAEDDGDIVLESRGRAHPASSARSFGKREEEGGG